VEREQPDHGDKPNLILGLSAFRPECGRHSLSTDVSPPETLRNGLSAFGQHCGIRAGQFFRDRCRSHQNRAAYEKKQPDARNHAKARYLDNIVIERLWRSLKYECVYLHAWETGSQARAGVGRWITFYNHQRPHAAHGGQPPAVVYFNAIETDQQVQAVA